MIVIVSKNYIKEGKQEQFVALAHEMQKESRLEEGCISYDIYQNINEPLVFTFVERWSSQEAVDAHNNSAHFKRIVPEIISLKSTPSKAEFYKEV